ncbi:sigma factor [Mobilicoccus sp.]|uniref:sigma factor n=1 Tax=Mobilicoccus sp. TaxID=2034349 RepID=UPI0028A868A9|nr:sigma factor [Mobilicoccus sp.]
MTFRGSDPRQVVEDVWRREAAHVLAALLRRGDSLDDCEDAAQEALAAALDQWPCEGVPGRPRGWLVTVASRRLVDQRRADSARVRREQRGARAEGRDRRGGSLTSGMRSCWAIPAAVFSMCACRAARLVGRPSSPRTRRIC